MSGFLILMPYLWLFFFSVCLVQLRCNNFSFIIFSFLYINIIPYKPVFSNATEREWILMGEQVRRN